MNSKVRREICYNQTMYSFKKGSKGYAKLQGRQNSCKAQNEFIFRELYLYKVSPKKILEPFWLHNIGFISTTRVPKNKRPSNATRDPKREENSFRAQNASRSQQIPRFIKWLLEVSFDLKIPGFSTSNRTFFQ